MFSAEAIGVCDNRACPRDTVEHLPHSSPCAVFETVKGELRSDNCPVGL